MEERSDAQKKRGRGNDGACLLLIDCHSGARAQLASPESRSTPARLWIPDSRFAASGMTRKD